MTASLRAAALALAVLLAGCGAGAVSGPGTTTTGSASPHGGESAATGTSERANRRLAERAARTLMAAVPLPPGSVRAVGGPAVLASAAPQPADGSVHLSGAWRVGAPVAEVRTWLRDHPAAGLEDSGTGGWTEGDGADVSSWYWDLPTTGDLHRAVERATLTVSVVPLGSGSTALRADAVVFWLVPTPWPDDGATAGAPLVRVTTSTPCPSPAAAYAAGTVDNPGAAGDGLDAALLPPDDPVSGVACLYGPGPAGGDRRARHVLDATEAARLAADVRTLPLGHPVTRWAHSCPLPPVRQVLLALAYGDGRQVDLLVQPACGGVRNGRIVVDRNLDRDWTTWVPSWRV